MTFGKEITPATHRITMTIVGGMFLDVFEHFRNTYDHKDYLYSVVRDALW